MKDVRFRTSSGSLVLVEESHALPMIDFEVTLRTGSVFDPAGKEGLARLTARMVRTGTTRLRAKDVEEAIDALGASLGIETAPSFTRFSGAVIRRNFEEFMLLLGELMARPSFRPADLEQCRREALADVMENRDNDRGLAAREFRNVVFQGHPYARTVLGTSKSIRRITTKDISRHYKEQYRAKNIIFGFAGDISEGEAKKILKKAFSKLRTGDAPAFRLPEPKPLRGRRVVVVNKPERSQTQIFVGGLGTHARDADHVALMVANTVFGGTFTSRLMKEVRSVRGWSYGASSRLGTDRCREAFYMWTFPSSKDAVACVELKLSLLEKLIAKGVSAKEVAFAKNFLINSNAFEIDTPIKRLDQRVDVELYGLPKNYFEEQLKRIRRVTHTEANRALKKRLSSDNLAIVMLATESDVKPGLLKLPGVAAVESLPFDAD